jgi:hypothetical protein
MGNIIVFSVIFMLFSGPLYAMGKKPPIKPAVKELAPIQEKARVQAELPAERRGARPQPVYIAELSNLNDYSIFANSGWDGNWYIGNNVCWIEELPAPPKGSYTRAFVGAKIGRMKARPAQGKPSWEKEPIPGSVYIAVSSTPSWKTSQSQRLADADSIPMEGDAENALEGVGESRWFWVEVPLKNINFSGMNYVAVWSPSEYFTSIASSPVLAGGWGSQKANSWMNNDIRGVPPANPATALKTAITVFEPAIALKLIPAGADQQISVSIAAVKDGRLRTANKTFISAITGDAIEKAWLELSTDGKTWERHGRPVFSSPYHFTVKADTLPNGTVHVRCVAEDIWGNRGQSASAELSIRR